MSDNSGCCVPQCSQNWRVTEIQHPECVSYGMYSAFIHVAVSAQMPKMNFFSRTFPPYPIKPTQLIQVPVNNSVNCYDYVALMINEWICTEYWWNNTDKRKLKYSGKNLSHCHTVINIPHRIAWDCIQATSQKLNTSAIAWSFWENYGQQVPLIFRYLFNILGVKRLRCGVNHTSPSMNGVKQRVKVYF